MHRTITRARIALIALLSLPVVLLGILTGGTAATATTARPGAVTSSSLGQHPPTFTGPAATGCASGCSLLTGPVNTPSTAAAASSHAASPRATGTLPAPHAMPPPDLRHTVAAAGRSAAQTAPVLPTVSCQPAGPGCDAVSTSPGGATGVKGLNAVDSGSLPTNPLGDIEPPDQGLCAGNGYVVEDNNIGEMMVFSTALQRRSAAIPLDTVMGLTSKGWSSAGDTSCEYDPSNGGHWFITEIVSANSEASGGAFTGCFAAKANTCYEGIAVSDGSSPFGPYHVYFLNADYNPAEPGSPYLLNDFAKIGLTRDAFLLFYDEFPLNGSAPGLGGGFFNGAQEFAFSKNALERGLPVTMPGGQPNPRVTVAVENMGLLPTPDGTCAASTPAQSGIDCWAAVIPGQPADQAQFDNSHGGSGFMMDSLDFNSFAGLPTSGDNRMAVWDWTGLSSLASRGCAACRSIRFGGQLFSGVDQYYSTGFPFGAQKAGPTPLGDECGAAGLSTGSPPPASCPEGGIATNGDFMTQVSQAQGQLWGSTPTEVTQKFASASPEVHQAALYWVVGTRSFDRTGRFTLTSQGYVSAAHEDLEMPAMAGQGSGGNGRAASRGSGRAIMVFTVNGNDFYPSTAYGRLTSTSNGLLGSAINIADAGQSPQDGFSEYQGYPGPVRPRWGDYSEAVYLPGSGGRIYFANEYIQYPNCSPPAFTLAVGTCGGTRDGFANWGTSVNYVTP